MMFETMIEFLTANPSGCLATMDGEKPRVRPFQFMLEQGGKLYFCTANTKEVYRQLQQNPWVEFSTTSKEMVTYRLSGRAKFEDNRQVKAAIIEKSGLVKQIYQTPDNPVFELFHLEHADGMVADFSGQPPKRFAF